MSQSAHLFITDSDFSSTDMSFCYLLGFQPSLGAMIYDGEKLAIFLDARYFSQTSNISLTHIRETLRQPTLTIEPILVYDMISQIAQYLEPFTQIVFEDNIALYYEEHITKKLPDRVHLSLEHNSLGTLRERKSTTERDYIKHAIGIIDTVFGDIELLKTSGEIMNMTEKELQKYIITRIYEHGGDGVSFDPIVASRKNSAVPHHIPDETKIGNGPLLIDMGAIAHSYCSDFTRTLWLGKKNTLYNEYMEVWSIVRGAYAYARDNFKLDMTGRQLDSLARNFIAEAGYEEYFTHSLGHGVGLQIHEAPKISTKSDDRLSERMVFTIEPGIYLPEKFGVRLENIVFVEDGKLVEYSQIPFSL